VRVLVWKLTAREVDILDAEVCARVARDFQLNRESLEAPTDETPPSEGWIRAPRQKQNLEARRRPLPEPAGP